MLTKEEILERFNRIDELNKLFEEQEKTLNKIVDGNTFVFLFGLLSGKYKKTERLCVSYLDEIKKILIELGCSEDLL